MGWNMVIRTRVRFSFLPRRLAGSRNSTVSEQVDSHHDWMRLLCRCLSLWKSTVLLQDALASFCWDLHRGLGDHRLPIHRSRGFAL